MTKALLRLSRYSWARGSIGEQRRRQERRVGRIPVDGSVRFDPVWIRTLRAEWVSGPGSTSRDDVTTPVVLYLHGGAYALGSLATHRAFLGRFASTTRTTVLAIEYRLAPEHPFPAALEDAVTAYRWLLSTGVDPARIVIAGDSAGGGLALATILSLRDAAAPLPGCAVCLSPWLDLTLSCASIDTNAKRDPILSREVLARYTRMYADGHDANDPLLSPLFSDMSGFPPILIHVAGDEILLDEAVAFTDSARAAGVDCEIEVWPAMFHAFQ
ncbi:MAG: alpha/beta hydrolase, partial [Spirochaetaceae bacterium]